MRKQAVESREIPMNGAANLIFNAMQISLSNPL